MALFLRLSYIYIVYTYINTHHTLCGHSDSDLHIPLLEIYGLSMPLGKKIPEQLTNNPQFSSKMGRVPQGMDVTVWAHKHAHCQFPQGVFSVGVKPHSEVPGPGPMGPMGL